MVYEEQINEINLFAGQHDSHTIAELIWRSFQAGSSALLAL